nr:MAG TPA: 50S ribosomal protein L10 [Caudoviricetes sp.]
MRTGLDALESLSVFELIEIAKEVTEIYGSGRR